MSSTWPRWSFPVGFLVWCLLHLGVFGAAPAAAEPNFQPVFSEPFRLPGAVQCSVALENGQILIGGKFETVNGIPQRQLARLNPDGSLDESWRPVASFAVFRMAVAEGFLYFFGKSEAEASRVALEGDGAVDLSWKAAVRRKKPAASTETVEEVAVYNGYIYRLTTLFITRHGRETVGRLLLRRLRLSDGKFDTRWGTKVANRSVNDFSEVHLQVDAGHVYIARTAYKPQRFTLSRYSTGRNGTLDRSWSKTIPVAESGTVTAFAQDESFIYFAGYGLRVPELRGDRDGGIARVSKQKAVYDSSWPPSLYPNGEHTVHGLSVVGNKAFMVDSAGVTSISTTGSQSPFKEVYVGDTQYDGISVGPSSLYVFNTPEYSPGVNVIRAVKRESFTADETFLPQVSRPGAVMKIQVLADGTTYVAGRFATFGNQRANGLVRFLPDGSLDSTWEPFDSLYLRTVRDLKVTGDSVIVWDGGGLGKYSLSSPAVPYNNWLADLPLQFGEVTAVQFTDQDAYFSYVPFPDFTFLYRKGLASSEAAVEIAMIEDRRPVEIFATAHFLYAWRSEFGLERYLLSSGNSLDATWKAPDNSLSWTARFASDGTYVYLGNRDRISRYAESGNGTADAAWKPSWDLPEPVEDLYLTGLECSGGFVCGSFFSASGTFIRRLDPNGLVDPSFKFEVPAVDWIDSPFVGFDVSCRWIGLLQGAPVLGGRFTLIDGVDSAARLLLTDAPAVR